MRPAARAFSLLELIAVMLIIALTLAITAPSLRGFAAAQETQETARNMLVLLQHARMQAALEARTYRLNIDPTPQINAYWLEVQDGGEYTPAPDSFGQRFTIPQAMIVEWVSPAPGPNLQGYITVSPNGTHTSATLRLIGRTDAAYDLYAETSTEPFRIRASPIEEVRQ